MRSFGSSTTARLIGAACLALVLLTGCGRESEGPPAPPTRYTVSVYGDAVEPLRTYTGTQATAGEGIAYIVTEGSSDYTKAVGTFVIEPENAGPATRSADSKYKVTLYAGSKVLREWYTAYATAGEGIGYIKTAEGVDYTRVAGTFTIEPLN